jgi:glutaredoxin 3
VKESCFCGQSEEPGYREPVLNEGGQWALRCPDCGHLDDLSWVSEEARPLVLGLARRRRQVRLTRPRTAQSPNIDAPSSRRSEASIKTDDEKAHCVGTPDDEKGSRHTMNHRKVVIYAKNWCPYVWRTKRILRRGRYAFETVDVSGDEERRAWLAEATGKKTTPQVFVDGRLVGGFEEMRALERSGDLERLVRGEV